MENNKELTRKQKRRMQKRFLEKDDKDISKKARIVENNTEDNNVTHNARGEINSDIQNGKMIKKKGNNISQQFITTSKTSIKSLPTKTWNFTVDYNDHFETPVVAYTDILPMLLTLARSLGKAPEDLIIYDPYYCQGEMVQILTEMGFPKVINRNRDFYADAAKRNIPPYDILITNPPYSGEHKPKLLDYLLSSVASASNKAYSSSCSRYEGKPFALLLPAYTATKSYWKEFVTELEQRANSSSGSSKTVLYALPPDTYEYRHPEGTGKDTPPFYSAWFLGGFSHMNSSSNNNDNGNNTSSSRSSGIGSSSKNNSSSDSSSSSKINGDNSCGTEGPLNGSSISSNTTVDITNSIQAALLGRQIRAGVVSRNMRVLNTVEELVGAGIVTDKRPNPKNRKKLMKHRALSNTVNIDNNVMRGMNNSNSIYKNNPAVVSKKKRF